MSNLKFHGFALILLIGLCALVSCTEENVPTSGQSEPTSFETKAVSPEVFDWETIDWMPTPAGQAKIPVPWNGQGSLVGAYSLDVINDHKKADGWRLLYSTFTSSGTEPINDPYFALYNVYRGIMRIYLYVTGSYVAASSYLQDSIQIVSTDSETTDLLDFISGGWINPRENQSYFNQIQPKPMNGGAPFASRRWYMFEYEFAFDPEMSSHDAEDMKLSWNLNFVNVSNVTFSGEGQTTVEGTIGSATKNSSGFLDAIKKGQELGGVVSIFGQDFLKCCRKNTTTYENSIGLAPSLFKEIYENVAKAASAFDGGIINSAVKLVSAIIGGSSATDNAQVSLKASTDFTIQGNIESTSAFPSFPVSFVIPATNNSQTVQGMIPLENEYLGAFNWGGNIYAIVRTQTGSTRVEDSVRGETYTEYYQRLDVRPSSNCYSCGFIVNQELSSLADVTIEDVKLIARLGDSIIWEPNEFEASWSDNPHVGGEPFSLEDFEFGLRFIVKVDPFDQSIPDSYIYKTFLIPAEYN